MYNVFSRCLIIVCILLGSTQTRGWAQGHLLPETIEPIKPGKANAATPVIRIVFDTTIYKELKDYRDLRFQLEPGTRKFNIADTSEDWTFVEFKLSETKGLYLAKFTSNNRVVTYRVRPVVQPADYEKAMRVYDMYNTRYQQALYARAHPSLERIRFLKDSVQELGILKWLGLNIFSVEDFEYSTDTVTGVKVFNAAKIQCVFLNPRGDTLNLKYVGVIYRNIETLNCFTPYALQIVPTTPYMIAGFYNNRFAYISYEDCWALHLTKDTKKCTFIMTVVSEKDNNVEYVKRLVER